MGDLREFMMRYYRTQRPAAPDAGSREIVMSRAFPGSFDAAELRRAYGDPPVSGVLRAEPADFTVQEQLGFDPDGEGEHVLLQLRKTGLNTREVARRVAALTGTRERDIGCCGLKDRNAQTVQWFSVPLPAAGERDWRELSGGGVEVLRSVRHRRKLRRGRPSR